MVRARAGDQNSAGPKHLYGAKVQFLVAAKGSVEITLALGERGGVENDGVVAPISRGVVLEQIESIAFDPLDLRLIQIAAVDRGSGITPELTRAGVRSLHYPRPVSKALARQVSALMAESTRDCRSARSSGESRRQAENL